MIDPQPRLIFWVALVALPFALVAALAPAQQGLAFAAIGLLLLAAAIDALQAGGALAGLGIHTDKIARLTQDKDGMIELVLTNAGEQEATVRIGLPFPAEIESKEDSMTIRLPAGASRSRFFWLVRSGRRGHYNLPLCRIERRSPLGFWVGRATFNLNAEVRVYPNLFAERKSMAAVFLTRGGIGIHHQRQMGKGREFEKLRDYIPGDALGDIHWKATAKRHRPATKVFQIERTQEVYIVIDASRLSARRSMGPEGNAWTTLLDRFFSAALIACLAAERQGDLFGLIVFSDKVQRFLPARNGRDHYALCRDAIYNLQPRLVTPDFDELFTAIRSRLRRRALLVVLTSLDDPTLAESFEKGAALVSRHHLMLVNQLTPPGAAELFAGTEVSTLRDVHERLAGHLQWQELRRLQAMLARRGVRLSLLERETMATQVVTQYLNVKQRQLL